MFSHQTDRATRPLLAVTRSYQSDVLGSCFDWLVSSTRPSSITCTVTACSKDTQS